MAKKICVICGSELGLLSSKVAISDGVVCSNCLKNAGINGFNGLSNGQSFSTASLKELFNQRIPIVNSFSPTKTVNIYMEIDDTHKSFKIGGNIFEFSNLLSFELLEDGHSISKGGLGRAVAGGLLFGGVGAIVGGVTGGKKAKGVCNSMKLKVTLRNAYTDNIYVNFITSETKTSSFEYKQAQKNAQDCISALEIIADQNQNTVLNETTMQPNNSSADEIIKFKQLLDAGVITQEEFDAKKKQLLGL